MYRKLSQIRPRTTELAALQRLKLMLPLFLGKLVAIHLILFIFVGFEDMQQILQLNMGLSAVERLKTYDVEKVVVTFLGCFQSNPFRCREAGKAWTRCLNIHNFNRYQIGPVSRHNRRLLFFRRFGSLVDVSGSVVW